MTAKPEDIREYLQKYEVELEGDLYILDPVEWNIGPASELPLYEDGNEWARLEVVCSLPKGVLWKHEEGKKNRGGKEKVGSSKCYFVERD